MVMSKGKNVILADCIPDEIADFRKGIEEATGLQWEVISKISNWGRTSRWSDIKRYFAYFSVPFSIFVHRNQYDRIIGWQQFYSLIFCFFCRLFHVKKGFSVSAINYTYKKKNGIIGRLYYHFMKYIATSDYLDHIMVLSNDYIEICAKELNVKRTKFYALCFGIPDLYDKYKETNIEDKALSIGRSNRDYDWLIEEWKDIDYPLVIISDTYVPRKKMPTNVTLVNNVSGDEQFPLIMSSRIVILPIDNPAICSGDTVLLTSMSFMKDVIVTSPSTLAEMYVVDGYNGHVINKNQGSLKKCVESVLAGDSLGLNARTSYLKYYSRYKMGLLTGEILSK